MKIERVDEKTVKCFLSNEDLEEYQIDYKDFVMRSERAKQVVHEIMEEATRQVGYKPPKFAFDMQIMMTPDEGLVLTFSEPDPANMPNIEQIMSYLKEMKQAAQRGLAKEQQEIAAIPTESEDTENSKAEGSKAKKSATEKPGEAIFVFESLTQVLGLAAALPANLRMQSALYEMDGAFYLYLGKGSASYERYSRVCIQAMEFGKLYGTDETKLLPMREHGSCLIEEKALSKLRF